MSLKGFQIRMCEASMFIAIIAYVLVGYYTNCWTWSLFIFTIVPLMPFLVGIQKIHFTYDVLVIFVYLILGFTINGWHPWWILFLTIPIYHLFFNDFHINKKDNTDINSK